MTSIEIRHLALDYAVRDSLTYTSSPPADPASIVARAKAYEAYLVGGGELRFPTGVTAASQQEAAQRFHEAVVRDRGEVIHEPLADWERELLNTEPPVGSVVVLRSATTERLIGAQRVGRRWITTDGMDAAWDRITDGRDVVSIHTPDGA